MLERVSREDHRHLSLDLKKKRDHTVSIAEGRALQEEGQQVQRPCSDKEGLAAAR